jgi:RluA family pseudouridine synthase
VSAAPRERFDPPLLRARWTTDAALARDALLADLRARSGWDAARIASLLWHGGLFLDGRPCSDATPLASIPAGTRIDAYAFAREPEPVPFERARILHEADDWLAVDKPAWMTTQRSRASERLSLEVALRVVTGVAALVAVHRLDRETSGVVVFAKTPAAAARLGRAFAEGRARKRYLARVAPVPQAETWEISGFLGRVLDPKRYRFALGDAEAPGFRASHTRFARVHDDGATALVACEPTTGRSHQLRVHLAASGTPIVGDALYGGIEGERTLLHASELELPESEGAPRLIAPAPVSLLAHSFRQTWERTSSTE